MNTEEVKQLIKSKISLDDFIESISNYNISLYEKDFNKLVTACRKTGRRDILEYLLRLRYMDEEIHNVSNLTSAFLDNTLSENNLKFIVDTLDYSSFVFVVSELIEMNQTEDSILAAKKAFDIFGPQSYQTLKSLVEYTQEKKNVFLENFLSNQMKKVASYAKYPDWVSDYGLTKEPDDDVIQKELERIKKLTENISIQNDTKDNSEMALRVIEKLKELNIEFEDEKQAKTFIKEKLDAMYESKEITELILNKKLLQDLFYDENLFRWYGPDNPTETESLRMFTCYIYDYDDETNIIEDWFTGSCDNCYLKIRRRVHSLRIPMPAGGWLGCYCSFKCLREGISNMEYESKEYYETVHVMTNILEDEIRRIGIQDRPDS